MAKSQDEVHPCVYVVDAPDNLGILGKHWTVPRGLGKVELAGRSDFGDRLFVTLDRPRGTQDCFLHYGFGVIGSSPLVVNGKSPEGVVRLADGDILTVGPVEWRIAGEAIVLGPVELRYVADCTSLDPTSPCLVVLASEDMALPRRAVLRFEDDNPFTIGFDNTCTLQIAGPLRPIGTNGEIISIYWRGRSFTRQHPMLIGDRGSTEVKVNGARATERYLNDGDIIEFGAYRFEYGVDAASRTSAEVEVWTPHDHLKKVGVRALTIACFAAGTLPLVGSLAAETGGRLVASLLPGPRPGYLVGLQYHLIIGLFLVVGSTQFALRNRRELRFGLPSVRFPRRLPALFLLAPATILLFSQLCRYLFLFVGGGFNATDTGYWYWVRFALGNVLDSALLQFPTIWGWQVTDVDPISNWSRWLVLAYQIAFQLLCITTLVQALRPLWSPELHKTSRPTEYFRRRAALLVLAITWIVPCAVIAAGIQVGGLTAVSTALSLAVLVPFAVALWCFCVSAVSVLRGGDVTDALRLLLVPVAAVGLLAVYFLLGRLAAFLRIL